MNSGSRFPHLGQRGGQIWCEGAVNVGLQLAEVDFNELVVLAALVRD
jgi:hypothetical protein